MKGKVLKGGLTVFGAIAISSLGLFASDALQGIDRNLVGLAGKAGICPGGMAPMVVEGRTLCFDLFEASVGGDCQHSEPSNILQTEENVSKKGCYAASRGDASPWRFVSLPQAQRLCAEAGKRLPSADEWYRIALGTDIESCNIRTSGPKPTGESECVSSVGAYDLIGNLWEWVDASVEGKSYNERSLPDEGYVSEVDASGVAIKTTDTGDELYGKDYFWSKEGGTYGMIRGGFFGSESDAGFYTVNAAVPTSFATQGVGFRCVMDVL